MYQHMYQQFIYGKHSNGSGNSKVIAKTPSLQIDEQLHHLARGYKVWHSFTSSGSKQAVGSILRKEEKEIVLIQSVRTQLEASAFNQYRYIIIPVSELNVINYRTDKLLAWLWEQRIPKISSSSDTVLPEIRIPILEGTLSGRASDKEIKQINDCLQEVDNKDRPFLVSALSVLTGEGSVVINSEKGFRRPESYLSSITMLIPAACRPQVSVILGNIDAISAEWANLILGTTSQKGEDIEQLCRVSKVTYFSRSQNKIVGSDEKIKSSPLIKNVENIICNRKQWVPNLLKDLNRLQDENLLLSSIPNLLQAHSSVRSKIKIGLWGLPGSGKTTYLTKLYDCLEKGRSDFRIVSESKVAREFIAFHLGNLERGSFSAATDPSIDPKILTYEIQAEYSLFPFSMELSFVDAPGEWYQRIGELSQDGEEILNPGNIQSEFEADGSAAKTTSVIDYLIDCDGIIFLLDPKADRGGQRSHQYILPRVFRALRRHAMSKQRETTNPSNIQNKLTQFMAFCATKVDEEEYWSRINRPDDLVKSLLGQAVEALPTFCYFDSDDKENSNRNRCKFFAVSSIGRALIGGNEYSSKESVAIKETDGSEKPFEETVKTKIHEKDEDLENEGWAIPFDSQLQSEYIPQGSYEIVEPNPYPYNVSAPLEWLVNRIQEHKLPLVNEEEPIK